MKKIKAGKKILKFYTRKEVFKEERNKTKNGIYKNHLA